MNKKGLMGLFISALVVLWGIAPTQARPVGEVLGDQLHIEATPRNNTPDITVGKDDGYVAGSFEVDGEFRADGTLTLPAGSIEKADLEDSAIDTPKLDSSFAPAEGTILCHINAGEIGHCTGFDDEDTNILCTCSSFSVLP